MKAPVIVACGLGVNSVALLVGLKERGIVPNAITFADTGSEKRETYAYLPVLADWLASVGMPPLVVVQNDGKYKTLENNCLQQHMLPSIAYGFRACADKYKHRPQHKYLRRVFQPTMDWWAGKEPATGERRRVVKMIGYGADERQRAKVFEDAWYVYEYPLIEWGWGREDCQEAIDRAGLPQPPKSACFFCPSSKKREVLWLAQTHPDLFERAVAMEKNADLKTVKGLGRRYSWQDLVMADSEQPSLDFDGEAPECMCVGETTEEDDRAEDE